MGSTTAWQIPYPELTDPPDGPAQMSALAGRVDTCLTQLDKPPICALEQSLVQSIPNTTSTPITFDLEVSDTSNLHSPSTNPARITVAKAGWYELSGAIAYSANTTGRRFASWTVTGTAVHGTSNLLPAAATSLTVVLAPTIIVKLIAGDYIELRAYHDAGAPLNTFITAGNRSYANARYVSAP